MQAGDVAETYADIEESSSNWDLIQKRHCK